MELVFATNNENKIKEINALLTNSIKILSLKDIGCHEGIPETADTIKGNAILKAKYVYEKYGYDCFADDTGLEIKSLNDEPGVFSARYAGEEKNADKNMNKVLQKLALYSDRTAQFKTVVALVINGETSTFEGIVEGEITSNKHGKNGFGYDPIFKPNGYKITFAEMPLSEKNKISHRGRAVKKLIDFLNSTK
ncbi:MAG: non-canonical purine NTP diphosphatase [Flavobacteriales bacterium]|nr:non-canonical purine NTP diphosphatase [Flavobacteriales bacterium]MCW8912418.1 non-canonical purine NTP diphosphatase [Flavobacteriales bacterium]MCW8936502.1 non-canonical purine NTP diphosphatase [Flavobacteriales bacterium]MCW8941261.1 non-canonical purine NTP diphosphatase [Flavobacteriales bacterium]MCW8969571.1 non-canonical purine NTP diphosphatase [Flavobacteriales bacterium]